ncbi:hypothetical protein FA95DRAFT_1559529 [Auriscalpium vulgare]|uniref:Uncharacterized protein n=1 Tax=Auriscalpium vulgare TaxID=40419 RepID=A0ACB8RSI4_9AGAM|nr:hypothetical protein FA95DRAFT_1559529 [Auriscalpium vulgare]
MSSLVEHRDEVLRVQLRRELLSAVKGVARYPSEEAVNAARIALLALWHLPACGLSLSRAPVHFMVSELVALQAAKVPDDMRLALSQRSIEALAASNYAAFPDDRFGAMQDIVAVLHPPERFLSQLNDLQDLRSLRGRDYQLLILTSFLVDAVSHLRHVDSSLLNNSISLIETTLQSMELSTASNPYAGLHMPSQHLSSAVTRLVRAEFEDIWSEIRRLGSPRSGNAGLGAASRAKYFERLAAVLWPRTLEIQDDGLFIDMAAQPAPGF